MLAMCVAVGLSGTCTAEGVTAALQRAGRSECHCKSKCNVQVFWVIGPTSLLIVTFLALAGLFAVDFVPIPNYVDLEALRHVHE